MRTQTSQIEHPRKAGGDPLTTTRTWELMRLFLVSYFRFLHFGRYRCVHNIPDKGPILLAPNHVSYYDPPIIAAGVPHVMHFMTWDVLCNLPIIGRFVRSWGSFPVKLRSADKGAITQSLRILRAGACLMIFPEGERSRDGNPGVFEPGAARLILQTGGSVVPVTITGAHEAWPRIRLFPRLFRPIVVKFHRPIAVEAAHGRDELRDAVPALIEAIRRPIERRHRAWLRLQERHRRGRRQR